MIHSTRHYACMPESLFFLLHFPTFFFFVLLSLTSVILRHVQHHNEVSVIRILPLSHLFSPDGKLGIPRGQITVTELDVNGRTREAASIVCGNKRGELFYPANPNDKGTCVSQSQLRKNSGEVYLFVCLLLLFFVFFFFFGGDRKKTHPHQTRN